MSLVSDASPHMDMEADAIKKSINLDILGKIESDLDVDDVLSILFLMVGDYRNAFLEIFKLYRVAKEGKRSVIAEIVKDNRENWEGKLVESLCICNNRNVIKKLGLRFESLKRRYLPGCGLYTKNVNPIAKCLYLLCESLDLEETKMLLRFVKEDKIFLSIVDEEKKYKPMLEDTDRLELHLLYWMNIGYISILSVRQGNFKDLLKHLKAFDHIDLITANLKEYDRNRDTSDSGGSEKAPRTLENRTVVVEADDNERNIRKIKKGLCVIINQMHFRGTQYETRFGTSSDAFKLSETFKGLGFTVSILDDLTKDEMLSNIRDLSKRYGCDYDCIFLCILSHGCKGAIIAVDEKEVSIECIDDAFCCPEFSKIIKIVICQACQGKTIGKVLNHNPLTTDGPIDEPSRADITGRVDFCIFMSTMQNFASVRDKRNGTWFIQELCDMLQRNRRKIGFVEFALQVIQTITEKRGIMNGDSVAQLPELRCRLVTDFELPRYNP